MSYLNKLGIQIKNGWAHYKNKRVRLQDFDKDNIYDKIIHPLGIRKTRGSDYYDGKRFIKVEPLVKDLLRYRKRYSVTVQFKYRYQDKDGWREAKNYAKTTYNTYRPEEPKMDRLQRAAIEHLNEMGLYKEDYEIKEILRPQVIELEKVKSLKNHPVFGSRLAYPNLKLSPGEQTGLCGFEFLLKSYPKRAKSIEQLEELFNKERDQGLTANDFLKFAKHHNLGCYISDL